MATQRKQPASGGMAPKKAKETAKPVRLYDIGIEWMHSPVKVSRVITIPSDVKLEVFASIIQHVMGWGGGHLDAFNKNGIEYTDAQSVAYSRGYGDRSSVDYQNVSLDELLTRKGSNVVYVYDFGDSWQHKVSLHSYRDLGADEKRQCKVLKGEGACPPDDVGGVWGYADMLHVLANPDEDHEQYEEYIDWLGDDFDPNHYDIDRINKALQIMRI